MLVAVALGSLLFPNLVMLFYPVTRGSVVLQASGISYPDAIRCAYFCVVFAVLSCGMQTPCCTAAGYQLVFVWCGLWQPNSPKSGDAVLPSHSRQCGAAGIRHLLP
jgi:hypothetical protein